MYVTLRWCNLVVCVLLMHIEVGGGIYVIELRNVTRLLLLYITTLFQLYALLILNGVIKNAKTKTDCAGGRNKAEDDLKVLGISWHTVARDRTE